MIPAPITAIRSLPPRPRRSAGSFRQNESRLVERLAATVTALEGVPEADLVLTELPAEIDLLAVDDGREVDEPPVDVTQHDAGTLDGVEQPPHLEKRDPDLPALLA